MQPKALEDGIEPKSSARNSSRNDLNLDEKQKINFPSIFPLQL